ncbi:hypothetical protein ACFFRR_002555 [Megaselia abdita]
MVIQREWNNSETINCNSIGIITPVNSSGEDSNGSNVSTLSSSNSFYFQQYKTTPQMANNVFNQLRKRFDNKESVPNKGEAVMRALELLRINIQSAFDKEIDVIVKKFTELYFDTAFKNIKENLGEHGISEDVLQRMTCALLENSKIQYNAKIKSNTTPKCSVGEKRPYPEPIEMVPIKKEMVIKKEEISSPSTTPHVEVNKLVTTKPRQIFWNTGCINVETRFILDIQANQAFGFGNDGKERLASKHPELIRYLPDGADRDWLVEQKVIPSQHKNFRFLFLLYDEVMKLGMSEKYCQKDNLNLGILHYFRIPKFMIDKMHVFFIDLNIKSKGLISNTFTDKKTTESELDKNSHLRNALLQGTSTQMIVVTKEQPIVEPAQQQLHILTTNAGTSSTTIFQQSNGTIFQVKPKPSLSLSHATLTALLRSNKVTNTNSSV